MERAGTQKSFKGMAYTMMAAPNNNQPSHSTCTNGPIDKEVDRSRTVGKFVITKLYLLSSLPRIGKCHERHKQACVKLAGLGSGSGHMRVFCKDAFLWQFCLLISHLRFEQAQPKT